MTKGKKRLYDQTYYQHNRDKILARHRTYKRDPEYQKQYYRANRDRILKQNKEYRAANSQKIRAQQRRKYNIIRQDAEALAARRNQLNARRAAARQELIAALGGKCARCGFADWRALQVDHVNGGGVRHLRAIKLSSPVGYLKLIRRFPAEFQLLCANCNWIKLHERGERPHKSKMSPVLAASLSPINTKLQLARDEARNLV